MEITKKKIAELKPHPKNPRKHPKKLLDKLQLSIREYGFTNPVLISKDNQILAGHARCKAAEKMGIDEVPVIQLDLNGTKADAYVILDNKLNELSEWDAPLLIDMIKDIESADFDVSVTGFDDFEIEELLNDFYLKESIQDNFSVDEEKEEIEKKDAPSTKKGDIWLLGDHRLICGDSTNESDFQTLMDGKKAQCAVTSPPYGVGKEYEKAGIKAWFETVKPAITNICKHTDIVCWNIGDLFVTGSQFIEPTEAYSINMFSDNKFRPIWVRIWKKQSMNFGVGPYHIVSNKPVQQYEYITAFASNNYKFVKRLNQEERKNWGYAGIWEIATVRANKEHPAMFPVELPWRCIKMHSDIDGIVLEPFGGCGTTLIACEQTKRKCYAIEISPVYCDLIVKRWEKFTGKSAKKLTM